MHCKKHKFSLQFFLLKLLFFTMSAAYASRFEAVFLCTHPKGPKMSRDQAAHYMKKSKAFVSKWVKRYSQTKTVDDLPDRGKSKKTSVAEDKRIVQLFAKNPLLSLRSGQEQLKKKGLIISLDTIKRRLVVNGVKYRSTVKKPLLSETHIEKRLHWARENKDRDWDKIIFSDEASFWAAGYSTRAWTTADNRLMVRTVKHPLKVHVWGCFSKKGFGNLYLFTGTLDAEKMTKIYEKALLPSAKKMFPHQNDFWILQEDNDPKHRSRLCTTWKAEHGINVLDWPSQSPDANPIENVWAWMKLKLRAKNVVTAADLTRELNSAWRSLPRSYAEKLAESMPRRCQAIMDNNGDWTPY